MTNAQMQTLAAHIRANTDPAVVAALDIGNHVLLAELYNALTSFICWKSRVTQDEIMQNGFDWVRVDNLSVGKARIWEWLFKNNTQTIDPSKENVRAGIDECWKGTAADLAVRAAVYVHCKRQVTLAESVFATGTGTDATPGSLGWEGTVSYTDVGIALGLGG